MTRSALALVFVFAATTALSAHAQATGRVVGTVTDESGGVLPGVSVTAVDGNGRVLGTATTDAVGKYAIDGLPFGDVAFRFQLDGFAAGSTVVAVSDRGDVRLLQRLAVAPREESVTVVGTVPPAPLPPPEPPVIAPPAPPRAPHIAPVVEHARESVCGPAKLTPPVTTFGTIRSGPKTRDNGFYIAGDQLLVKGGTVEGLGVGENFAVRRSFKLASTDKVPTAEHTAGVVQIVSATDHEAVAMVVYTCDELMQGDELTWFRPEPVRSPEPPGAPAFDDAAMILFADRGQLVGGPNRLMVINRGLDNGVHASQRLTLFRRPRAGSGAPTVIGDAVVVAVRADSATIRVERATDVIAFGDFAAPQRYRGTR